MAVVSSVPTIVARGTVLLALAVSPAGIVAHSMPRNANNVSVVVAISPLARLPVCS
jgi:hypothetical protein